MHSTDSVLRPLALLTVVLALAANSACSGPGDSGKTSGSAATAASSAAAPSGEPAPGGKVVFGAEQWPQCLNPITSCADIGWLWDSMLYHVIPRAMTLDEHGHWIPSPLLTEAPTLANGGIAKDPFTITFHLDPNAVWTDGTPITAADFAFTWKAIMHTTGTLITVGYDRITSIEGPDPHTVVIRFSEVVVDWQDLFGGPLQGVLEKAAFPNADPERPDLRTAMNTSIPFSGGPWLLKSWDRQQAVLVRNPKYWGRPPLFDEVVFVPREEQSTEITSLLSGEVSVIYTQPSNVSILRQVQSNPNVAVQSGPSPYYEAMWLNVKRPPLDDGRVREALMYAIDRQGLLDTLVKINNPAAEVLNCGALAYANLGPWCQGPGGTPFAKYHYDPQHAMQILESAGWDCSAVGAGGFCKRDGRDLTVEYTTVAGNSRRESTQALEIPKAKAAGFRLVVRNYQAGDLFSNVLPKGEFGMADFAYGGSPDPSVKSILGCDSIPTAANGWSGQNIDRWCDPQAWQAMQAADRELDEARRAELMQEVYAREEADHVMLPLYQLPEVSAWRKDKLAGPVGLYNDSILSVFANMDRWYCASPGACR